MNYCFYFQANIDRPRVWYFTATLRSFDNLCFDRTRDVTSSLFEFFVPEENKEFFMRLMDWYQAQGIVSNFSELPNRLRNSSEQL